MLTHTHHGNGTATPTQAAAAAERVLAGGASGAADPDLCRANPNDAKTKATAQQPALPTRKATHVTRLHGCVRDWQPRFLETLRTTANGRHSCTAAGIWRMTAYREKERKPEFAMAYDDAMQDAVDLLHKTAWERAAKGALRPVFQGGVLVGHDTDYSNSLLMFLLQALRPEMFSAKKAPAAMKLAVPAPPQTPAQILDTVRRVTPLIRNRAAGDQKP